MLDKVEFSSNSSQNLYIINNGWQYNDDDNYMKYFIWNKNVQLLFIKKRKEKNLIQNNRNIYLYFVQSSSC